MEESSYVAEARQHARWWLGCYGAIGAAAVGGLSLFDTSRLSAIGRALYLILLVLALVTVTEMLLSTRGLFPKSRSWGELTETEQARCAAYGYSSDTLKTMRINTAQRDTVHDIESKVVAYAAEADMTKAFERIGERLRRYGLFAILLVVLAWVLRYLPVVQQPTCANDLTMCPISSVTSPAPKVKITLKRDGYGSTKASLLSLKELLEEYGCDVGERMDAIAVGGDYLNPIVMFTEGLCHTGPVRIPPSIGFITP